MSICILGQVPVKEKNPKHIDYMSDFVFYMHSHYIIVLQ